MSAVRDVRPTWSPEHPVRLRFIHNGDVAGYLTLDAAVERIHGYERRGAVPQPPGVRERLLSGDVIPTHITEYELLAADPGDGDG